MQPINDQAVKVIVLAFSRSFVARLALTERIKMLINSPEENLMVHGLNFNADVVALLFRSIVKEYKDHLKPTAAVQQMMTTLLTKLCEQSKTRKEPSKTNQLYYAFLKLLDEKIAKTHRVSDYANALGISEKSLTRVCRAITQHAAQSIIHQKINFEARRQLFHNQSSAKEIAYSVGFTDPIQFSKFFKHHNQMTPLEYRRNARGGKLS